MGCELFVAAGLGKSQERWHHLDNSCCPSRVQEPGNLAVWRKKFGFQKLDARALKSLQSSVPALNYYEDATLLAKPLKKGRAAKAASGGGGGKLDEAASLPVQPLEA